MKKPFLYLGTVAVLVVLGAGIFFLGDRHGLQTMSIQRATPDLLANAMEGDHFYSDYGKNTLIVQGVVASVNTQNGDTVIGFKTSSTYQALCDLGTATSNAKIGDTVTVLAEGGTAERQSSAVLLTGCTTI